MQPQPDTLTNNARKVWAFARDGGLPGSKWLSKVWHAQNTPVNSILVTALLSYILCLITIGSTIAFNIIISLDLIAFFGTYILSIGCLIHRRLRGAPLPSRRWSLGTLGLPINIFAFLYSWVALIFACFPVSTPTDPVDANWGPVIWAGVLIIAVISYLVQGRRIYKGPVVYVEGVRSEGTAFQKA